MTERIPRHIFVERKSGDPTPNNYEGLIPLDKSWIVRQGVLDIIHGKEDIKTFLNSQANLADDLQALKRAAYARDRDEPIDVGESGTLFRFLQFTSWKYGLEKKFIKRGSLVKRDITDNPGIVNYNLEDLLLLDNGTTQWASAAILLGNDEEIESPSPKIKLTYEALDHWREKREEGHSWEPRKDETLRGQMQAFVEMREGGDPIFIPQDAEDYCFARVFGFITKEEGRYKWPNLRGHESNRIEEVENALDQAEHDAIVASRSSGSTSHSNVGADIRYRSSIHAS